MKRLPIYPRIRELLIMLTWYGDNPDFEWLEWTRYMKINNKEKSDSVDEYKERRYFHFHLD